MDSVNSNAVARQGRIGALPDSLGLANASRFSWKDSAQRVDLHITQALTAQAPSFGGDKPASFSSRRSSTLLEDVKGKSPTKTN